MNLKTVTGILIPFAGTTPGSAMVYVTHDEMSEHLKKALTGFAAGVMTGMGFLLIPDVTVPHMQMDSSREGPKSHLRRTTKLILAVTLHNIPEGMAAGVVYAGWISGNMSISYSGAPALALGIAIQNFPEGAIVSMPLRAAGMKKNRTFWYGVLSGTGEPIGSILTILFASAVTVYAFLCGRGNALCC